MNGPEERWELSYQQPRVHSLTGAKFRQMINRALRVYEHGFELLARGEITAFAPMNSRPEDARAASAQLLD